MKIYRFLSLFISSFRSQKVSGNEVVIVILILLPRVIDRITG